MKHFWQKIALVVGLAFTQVTSAAVYEIGNVVSQMCWEDADAASHCLSDSLGEVTVLLYNTGWCPDCQQEMLELVPRLGEWDGKPVQFLSLSAAGFSSAPPDAEFLKKWKTMYSIPFPVLASPRDPGKKFFVPPYSIPAAVIVGADGKLAYKAQGPTVDAIFDAIRQALRKSR